jgi:hypothetical protein
LHYSECTKPLYGECTAELGVLQKENMLYRMWLRIVWYTGANIYVERAAFNIRMKALCYSETLVAVYKTARRHVLENSIIHSDRLGNVKYLYYECADSVF